MPYEDVVLEAEEKMEKAVEVMVNEFKGVRTGRASPGLVEGVRVEYYGAPTPLKGLASITVPEPRLIMIKPFDAKALGDIEKAIQKSDLGLNPQSDGKILRLVIPPLSEERRKQMSKLVKDIGEKAKVALRNVRRDANAAADAEEKEKKMSEDEKKRTREELDRLIKAHEAKIADLVERKIKEVMEG
ncbi:MAG: ribosome recycling factor [Planctomycetes bacterium]|nr:ribosome recycling factor [Planctomycetota bacterium]